jgi:PhnB protein
VARVSTYLNFPGTTEEAFTHYRDLFGTQFVGDIMRFRDMGIPNLTEEQGNDIMHMEVEIAGGHLLMATDMIESMGQILRIGNNTTIMVEVDSREEVDRLFAGLASGVEEDAPADQAWGQYWSVCLDRFGIRWMIAGPREASSPVMAVSMG